MTRQVRRLAVYGTLVPGRSNAAVLAEVAGEWSHGTIAGTRHARGWRGYPGVELGGADRVDVAVLHAPRLAEHLARLDDFEGPGYRRVTTDVTLDDGRVVRAHVYELTDPPPPGDDRG